MLIENESRLIEKNKKNIIVACLFIENKIRLIENF
jgi:hypothetical protein